MSVKKYLERSLDVLYGPRRRLGPVEREILEQLSSGDLLIGLLCSSRSAKVMYRHAYQRAKARYAAKLAIASLERKGLVKLPKGGETVALTAMGRSAVLHEINILRDAKRGGRKWDGRWRIVSFDVPQEYRTTRNALRRLLERAEFRPVQKSVYIHPHSCNALLTLLQEDRNLAKYTFFCTAAKITNQEVWKKKFGLS